MTSVTVEHLKKIAFSQLSLHEKMEIKNKGRPTPDIIITQEGISKNKKYIRSFNSEWYKKIKWLCGCETRNALFCFPCLLYGGDTVWTQSGFRNINRIKEKCEKHQNSRKHMDNIISFSLLGQVNISEQLSEAYRTSKMKHNEQVKKKREILLKIINCIKCCGKFELSLRGHNESDSSESPGVFKGLINFIATFDPSLQKHLDSNSVFKGTSKTIQNELLQCMLEVCQDHIASEISETSYVAVMADDTTDVSEHTQTVIVFRYELRGILYERFWGFFTPENATADGLSKCLLNEIKRVLKNDLNKLIAQTYDGANVMKGKQGGVQYKIQQVFQYANFIHCYAHQLNLIMKHITSSIKSVRLFFANLSGIATFFSKSLQRLAILDKHVNVHIPRSSNTRWNFNIRTVNTVFENKDHLLKCFEELQSLRTSDKTIQASTGLLALLKNETFIFWLGLFHKIMPHVEILYNQMQSRNVDANKIQRALNTFYEAISKIRNSESCESASTSKVMESIEVCDRICVEAKERFAFTNHLIAAKLFYQENFESFHKGLPTYEIKETCKVYPFLVQEKLETELQIFYFRKEFHNFNGLLSLLNALNEENLASVFSETIKLIKILVTIPMTTAEPERCFSTLKRVKSYLRNTMNQERLTALSMISIEKNMISQITNFNEKVIEKFCQCKYRRMDFIFK